MQKYIIIIGLFLSVNSFGQSLIESMKIYSEKIQNLDNIQLKIINLAFQEECSETAEYIDSSIIVNSYGHNYVENDQFQSWESNKFNLLISEPSKQMMLIAKSESNTKNVRENTITNYLSSYSMENDHIKNISHGVYDGQNVYHVSCSSDYKAETIIFVFDISNQFLTEMSVIYREKEKVQSVKAKRVNTIINYELNKITPIPKLEQFLSGKNGNWILSELYGDYSLTVHNM